MEDWKLKAPAAQRRILLLAVGLLPQSNAHGQITTRVIESAADRHLARHLADINFKIIERAYPPRVYDTLENMEDPLDELGKLIGIIREDMPDPAELIGYSNGQMH